MSLVLQGVVNGRLGCDIGIEVNHGVVSNTLETCACHNWSEVGVIYLPFHKKFTGGGAIVVRVRLIMALAEYLALWISLDGVSTLR